MKRFTAVLLLSLFMLPVTLLSQELTNKERRHINQKILNVIDEYERTASLSDAEETYAFSDLFVSQDAMTYCDIMGAEGYLTQMSVKDYIKKASSLSDGNIEIEILNVRKGEMSYKDGCWIIPVSFLKTMSYWDKNGVLFSAREYYDNEPYNITLNLRYDPKDDTCLIQSVEGRFSSSKSFPQGKFKIITKNYDLTGRNLAYARDMQYDGRPLQYNSFDQVIVPADFEPEVADPDVIAEQHIISSTDNYENVTYSFQLIKSRAKLRLGIAPVMAYSMKSVSSELSRSMAFEVGADIGTTFLAGSSKFGVYAGAALSMSNARFSLSERWNSVFETVIPEQMNSSGTPQYYYPQTVRYDIESATESLAFKDLMIPLYFECEHRIGTSVAIVWNLGVKGYVALDTDLGEFYVKGTRNDLPIEGVFDTFLDPVSYSRNIFSLSAMANLGADVNLVKTGALKNRFLATVKVGYEHGIMPVYATGGGNSSFVNSNPFIVYDPATDKDIASHSLINDIKLTRQAIWLELGIKIKM